MYATFTDKINFSICIIPLFDSFFSEFLFFILSGILFLRKEYIIFLIRSIVNFEMKVQILFLVVHIFFTKVTFLIHESFL